MKPIELAAQNPPPVQPLKQEIIVPKEEPKREPAAAKSINNNDNVKPVKEQKPSTSQNTHSEPSSSLGDIELESILSEFSVPEGEELPDDAELMSIFDMCKNNGM